MWNLRHWLHGPKLWPRIGWPWLLLYTIIALAWFLILSSFFATYQGSAVCRRPIAGRQGEPRDAYVLSRVGHRHIEVLLPLAAFEGRGLTDCPAGIPPERLPATLPFVEKARGSARVAIDGQYWWNIDFHDLVLPPLLWCGLIGLTLGLRRTRSRRTALRRIEQV